MASRYPARGFPSLLLFAAFRTLSPQLPTTGSDSRAARVDSIFAAFARPDAPGCAVGVFRAGEILYARGYGMANVAHGIALTPSTPIAIASTSKQFTALAVLLLAREGKLALDDDARRYIPELPAFHAPISIRQLLQHTSGLREQWNLFYMAGWRSSDVETAADFLSLVGRQRALNFTPGSEFLYNNTGYTLLALLVERVSGLPFRRFIAERVFKPVGMTHSDVIVDARQLVPRLADGYWGHDPAELRLARPPYSFAGSTGITTTVEDLAVWDRNFYTAEPDDAATLQSMTTPLRLPDGTEIGYGMGLFLGSHRGLRMVSHAGSDPGYRAEFVRFPLERLSVAVLCNAFDIFPTPLALRVADLYLPTTPAVQKVAVGSESTQRASGASRPASRHAGLYWNALTAQTRRFYFKDGHLLLDGGGEGMFALRPLGGGAYRLDAAPRRYVLTFSGSNPRDTVREDIEGQPPVIYRRVPAEAERSGASSALAGAYYSRELDVTWTVKWTSGQLRVEWHRIPPTTLTPVFGDVFQADNFFVLQFVRDRAGRVTALDVTTERARHVRFVRRAAGTR